MPSEISKYHSELWAVSRYMRLKYGIRTRVSGTCLHGESAGGGWDTIDLRQFHSFLICNGLPLAYYYCSPAHSSGGQLIIIKKMVPYLDVL